MSAERLSGEAFRRELLDLLGRAVPFAADGDEVVEQGVPTCALVVVEWQAASGRRWLSLMGMLGSGDEAPAWTVRMLAVEALEWRTVTIEDDD